jgi:hypothetical protein
VDLHIHSPIRLHVALNQLSTGTDLPMWAYVDVRTARTRITFHRVDGSPRNIFLCMYFVSEVLETDPANFQMMIHVPMSVSMAQLASQVHGGSRCSSVATTVGYVLDSKGSIPGRGKRLSSTGSDWPYGPPSLVSNGYRGLFHRAAKWPGRETHHSLAASIAEVTNAEIIPPLPHTSSWRDVIRHRDHFTFFMHLNATASRRMGE